MRAQDAARWAAPAAAAAAALLVAASFAASAAPTGRLTARAMFVSQDARGCVSTEVSVFVRGRPGKARLKLTVAKVDECNDAVLLSAQTRADLNGGALRVRPDLGAAALTATIPVVDKVSGEELAATIRVTWAAVEEVVSADTQVEEEEPGRFVRRAGRRSLRAARATGLVTVGGTELTLRPAIEASLSTMR